VGLIWSFYESMHCIYQQLTCTYPCYKTKAWLQNEDVTGKLARVVTSGTKLIRGWDNVLKFKKGAMKPANLDKTEENLRDSKSPIENFRESKVPSSNKLRSDSPEKSITSVSDKLGSASPENSTSATPEQLPTTNPLETTFSEVIEEEFEDDRAINHLIFVIHGIGQKLGERLDTVNFPGGFFSIL
jgi:hypothetical protein